MSLTHSVSDWQGHLLSCPGQLKSKSDPKSIACLTGFSALWNIHRHLKTTPICRFVTFSVCTFYQHHHPVDGPGLIHPCKKNRCSFSSIAPQLETGKQTQTSEMVSNVCTCSKGVERQGGGRRKVNKCLKNSFNVEEHYFWNMPGHILWQQWSHQYSRDFANCSSWQKVIITSKN